MSKFLRKSSIGKEKDVGLRSTIDIKVSLTSEDKCPIIAIVNKRSGGQMGDDVLKSFYRYMNPLQVIDLIDEGLDKLKLFRHLRKIKLIVGGKEAGYGVY